MDKKKLMLLLGALVIAIGTAMAARSLFAGASAPQAEAAQQVPKGPKVLVAQRALPVGTIEPVRRRLAEIVGGNPADDMW